MFPSLYSYITTHPLIANESCCCIQGTVIYSVVAYYVTVYNAVPGVASYPTYNLSFIVVSCWSRAVICMQCRRLTVKGLLYLRHCVHECSQHCLRKCSSAAELYAHCLHLVDWMIRLWLLSLPNIMLMITRRFNLCCIQTTYYNLPSVTNI